MKTLVSLMLCGVLLATQVQAQTNDPPPPPPQNGAAIVFFVLGCVAVGAYVIWRLHCTIDVPSTPVTVVLEKSRYDNNWVPVYTNTVIMKGTNWTDVFYEQMVDSTACYRARIIK